MENRTKGRKTLWYEIKKNASVYLLISPFFILYAIFGLFPSLYSLYLSFFKWKGSGAPKFVGWFNFQYLFKDPVFLLSIRNTFIIWCLSTIPMIILAVILAFLLNSSMIKGRHILKTIYFLPNVTSVVAVAIVFANMFGNSYGVINYFLTLLHFPPVKWTSSAMGVHIAIAAIVIWRWTGYNAIIALAGLQKIPAELYEAASIDGATMPQVFRKITLPLLNPVIVFILVTSTVGGWQLMAESQVLVGNDGGIGKSGMTVVLYLYKTAFLNQTLGYGSAISWALCIIILICSVINWLLTSRSEV